MGISSRRYRHNTQKKCAVAGTDMPDAGPSGIPKKEVTLCGDVIVTLLNHNDRSSSRIIDDLENIISASDDVLGKTLRKEIFSSVTIQDRLRLSKEKSIRWLAMPVEGKPLYVEGDDDDADDSDAELEDCTSITLKCGHGSKKIHFRDYWHEIGHGICNRMDSLYAIEFKVLYDGLLHDFLHDVMLGKDPVKAAEKVCSYQFFLGNVDTGEDGWVCWKGFVGMNAGVTSAMMQQYFHKNKSVPKVKTPYKLLIDSREAFCEFFANYFRLEREERNYSIVPDPKFASKNSMLYDFGRRYMDELIDSAKPHYRKRRKMTVP